MFMNDAQLILMASHAVDSQAELARKLSSELNKNVSSAYINQIARGERPIPFEFCAPIDIITKGNPTRQMLRPNDWQIHWPELVKKKAA